MPVPTYDRFIEPILRFLAAQTAPIEAREAHEAAAIALGLSEDDKALKVPSGQPVYKNRAGWAHDRLKRAGYSSSPKHGLWQLTPSGLEYFRAHSAGLSAGELERLARGFLDVRLSPDGPDGAESANAELAAGAVEYVKSPDDRLQDALTEIRAAVASELLDLLAQVTPTRFEIVVLDVLHKLGYGTSRSDLQRVGGSGDGGIDGVISLDRLGLEKVYVQAKRWQGTVGRPELQGFFGALAGQGANKGVFITTSAFTAQARDFARSVQRIVLIDGPRLADFMMDCEVGISSQQVRIPTIDSDYFDS